MTLKSEKYLSRILTSYAIDKRDDDYDEHLQ